MQEIVCKTCGELIAVHTQVVPIISGNSRPSSLPAGTVVSLAGNSVMLMHATLVDCVESGNEQPNRSEL